MKLEDLKRVWNSETTEKTYSTKDIFKILKRKSITSVKWVFIISMIELLSALLLYVYMFMNKEFSTYHKNLLTEMGDWAIAYELLYVIVYVGTIWFVYQFFKSYKQIKVHASVKELSLDIIKFRKVVNNFIYFNLVFLFCAFLIILFSTMDNYPELQQMDWFSMSGLGFIGGILFAFMLSLGFLWLYYYFVYGTFQRRLKRNLHNLETIDDI